MIFGLDIADTLAATYVIAGHYDIAITAFITPLAIFIINTFAYLLRYFSLMYATLASQRG